MGKADSKGWEDPNPAPHEQMAQLGFWTSSSRLDCRSKMGYTNTESWGCSTNIKRTRFFCFPITDNINPFVFTNSELKGKKRDKNTFPRACCRTVGSSEGSEVHSQPSLHCLPTANWRGPAQCTGLGAFSSCVSPMSTGTEPANSGFERDLMLEFPSRYYFKGLCTKWHFIGCDDPKVSWSKAWKLHSKVHIAAADSGGNISEKLSECGF